MNSHPTAAVDIAATMNDIGAAARGAAKALATSSADSRNTALRQAAATVRESQEQILAANRRDLDAATSRGLSSAMLDRLLLDEDRIESIAAGLEAVAALPDPLSRVIAEWERPELTY